MSIQISIIVVFYSMQREARRTLFTLSKKYQRGVEALQYEVIAVDCGPEISVDDGEISTYGNNFSVFRYSPTNSPAKAINNAVQRARGIYVTICIDGARMLSPGILGETITILKNKPESAIATFAFHLGYESQNTAIEKGYDQEKEDVLLAKTNWQEDGYQLFCISGLDGSSSHGWFYPLSESNCITISKASYDAIGGFDERFTSKGGGLVNLDFFARLVQSHTEIFILAGEGTFHQLHGGVSTNVTLDQHPWDDFHKEYIQIKGSSFQRPEYKSKLWGVPHKNAGWFLQYSYDIISEDLNQQKKQVNALHGMLDKLYEDCENLQKGFKYERKSMEREVDKMHSNLSAMIEYQTEIVGQLNAVLASKSWKYTRPIRHALEYFRSIVKSLHN